MNRPDADAEPSMEDILASIRKIIAEEPAQALAVPVVSPPFPASARREPGASVEAPDSLSARLQDVFGTGARLDTLRSPASPSPRPAPPVPVSRPPVDDDIDDLLADAPKLPLPSSPSVRPTLSATGQRAAPLPAAPVTQPTIAAPPLSTATPLATLPARARFFEHGAIPAPMLPGAQPPAPVAPLGSLTPSAPVAPERAETAAGGSVEAREPIPEPAATATVSKPAPVVIASMRAPSPAQLPTVQPAQPVAAATVTSDPPPSLAGPDPVVPTAQVAPLQPIEQPTVAPLAEMSAATLDPDAALLDARATEPVVIAAMPARPVAQAIERGDVASPSAALPQEAAPPPISPAPTIESREPSAAASPSLSSLTTAHPPLAALAIGLDTSGLSSVSAPVEVTPEPANDAVASALGALAAGLAASARPAAPVRAEIVVPAPPAIATPAVPDLVGDSQSSSAPTDQSVAVLASTVPSAEVAALAASVGFEDKAAGLLRPMLRQWLDDNMPRIVEKALLIELSESGLLEMALASRDEASKD